MPFLLFLSAQGIFVAQERGSFYLLFALEKADPSL
jgi:hypothetical protein